MINVKINTQYACFDGLLGAKNCGKEYSVYLDDYGFGLDKGSQQVDAAFGNAKNLIDTCISQAVEETIDAIHFKGLQANKIVSDVEYGVLNKDETFTGTKEITFTLGQYVKLGQFYLSNLEFYVKTGGTNTTITLIQNGVETEIYNSITTDNTIIQATVNAYVADTFTIKIVTDETLYNYTSTTTCGCDTENFGIYPLGYFTALSTNDGFSFGKINFQIRCNKVKHLCKYVKELSKAIAYKTLGKLYFYLHTTDTFTNYTNANKKDAVSMAIYYDSTYINLVNTDRNPNEKFGQWQLELDGLNKLIPPPKCNVCLECDNIGWNETKSLP